MMLFLVTIPFWTNLLIRTFAINQIIRSTLARLVQVGEFGPNPKQEPGQLRR